MKADKIICRTALAALLAAPLAPAPAARAQTAAASHAQEISVAQAGGTEPRDLQPRYQPVPPEPEGWYNSSYIFALTRSLAASTIHPAAKAPLFLFTVPLDLAFLPVATIGGFFG